MKAHKKSGASAPKDKSMEYKNSIAKKYAGEEAIRLSLAESQNDFLTGKISIPRNGAGTYAMYAESMHKYALKKAAQEKRALAKMNRKERKEYKTAKAQAENQSALTVSVEKSVYVVFPYNKFATPFCNTYEGAKYRLEKNYNAWIMSELECDYEEIRIETMPESQALTLIK